MNDDFMTLSPTRFLPAFLCHTKDGSRAQKYGKKELETIFRLFWDNINHNNGLPKL